MFQVFVRILFNLNLSLNQTILTFLVYERQTWLTQLILAISHIHGPAVYVKEGLAFAHDLCLENSANCYLCFRVTLLHSVSYFFFYYKAPSFLYTVFDSISYNTDDFLSISPSANAFVFGDLNVRLKDWLTYSGRTDRLVNFVIISQS